MGLYMLGVRKGDRVALHAENCVSWCIADLGILSLGAVTVPIYTTQPGDQIKFILEDAKATTYIVSTEALFENVKPYLADLPHLRHSVGIRGTFSPDMLAFGNVIQKGKVEDKASPTRYDELCSKVFSSDLASLVYTSGTTGVPKGVMLSHGNYVSNVESGEHCIPFDIEGLRGNRMISYLPLSHSLERLLVYLYFFIGYPIFFIEDHKVFLSDCRHVKPIHFSTVPRLLEKVHGGLHTRVATMKGPVGFLTRWAFREADAYDVDAPPTGFRLKRLNFARKLVLDSVRQKAFGPKLLAITSGGAALSAVVMNFFNAIGITCGQGYGLTETSPVISIYDAQRLRARSVGLPIRGVNVRIADDGEICVRGPNVMQGYYNRPDATAEVITDDGWFKIGDIGRIDEEGFLFITDRKKALMKLSTGKYVAPQPIESALSASPLIEHAMVVGNENKFCAAVIVPNYRAVGNQDGATEDDPISREHARQMIQAVIDSVNANLPHWEQVKRFVLCDAPFTIETGELTPTLKLKRRVIVAKYASEIKQMYAEKAAVPN